MVRWRRSRSLILAGLALASTAARVDAQPPPTTADAKPSAAELEAIRDRLVHQLRSDLFQINVVPDDAPTEALIKNRLRMMVSPRLTYDRLSQSEGVERKVGEVLFQTLGVFTNGGMKSALEYAPVYRIADTGALAFYPCRLELTYEVDEPNGITLQDSEGGNWEREGHQKFSLGIKMNFAAINKVYSDGSVIWFYGSGKVAAVELAITATYLDKPPSGKDRATNGKDRGVTFTLVDATKLDSTTADFRRIMQSCQPPPAGGG